MEPRPIYDFAVEGPVQAEIFVLFLEDGAVKLTGPCGAAPWLIEIQPDDDPVEAVTRLAVANVGHPAVVHSTSWRRDRAAVILSFIVVIDAALATTMKQAPVVRADLARGDATEAPKDIAYTQVLEHGLRHLAWLLKDDEVVRAELGVPWVEALADYTPEPFRNL